MKYQAHFNFKPSKGEMYDGISPTIQGQAYSVKEALARIQKGLPVTGRTYAYQDDDETEPPMRMNDLTDLDAARYQLKQLKKEQSDAVKKIKEAAAKKEAERAAAESTPGPVKTGG